MDKTQLWLWYISLVEEENGMGLREFGKLKKIEELYNADDKLLEEKYKFTKPQCRAIDKAKKDGRIENIKNRMEKNKIKLITAEDESFPKKLLEKDDVRYLFYKGNLPEENILTVGMVGARACSAYGRNMAKQIGRSLALSGVNVISGMARGIDTYSHLGALEGGGRTFAVLGCGVDVCYPTENIELYEDILNSGGGIISEYLPGTAPLAWHFPYRNRIISGLSDRIAVIEAKAKSGSLITVDWALEQGRDVYALPGRVGDMLSSGCNNLIKNGAGIITKPDDVIEDYLPRHATKNKNESEKANEKKEETVRDRIVRLINNDIISLETIVEKLNIDRSLAISELMELQLEGKVEEVSCNCYRL